MMKTRFFLCLLVLIFSAGCATSGERADIRNLKEELSKATFKLESLKKENMDLKDKLVLLQKTELLDSQKFLDVESMLRKDLTDEVAGGDAQFDITDRGLVVMICAEKLFVSGTYSLSDEGKVFLDKIGEVLKNDFFSNYVYIEGHTDNQSLAVFEWKSDWDFSFARALSVLKYFSEKGYVDPLRLSAAGFGQYRPRETNATKEGRRANRRIEIIVSPKDSRKDSNNA